MKLKDLPMYIPLIKIIDNGSKTPKPRFFGNDVHDTLVVDGNNRKLHYYNCQCGDGSECGDFNFARKEPICIDDEFYSRWCENVNLGKLIQDHDKEVRKQVCDEIREILNSLYQFNDEKDKRYTEGFADGTNICLDQIKAYLDQIEKGE